MLPELNQLFRYVNGNLNWWGKLKFAWYRWRGKCRKLSGVVFGVTPEHQAKGVDSAMAAKTQEMYLRINRYDSMEMMWIGDFNPKMMIVARRVGGRKHRVFHTYRKLFDPNVPFERHPIIK